MSNLYFDAGPTKGSGRKVLLATTSYDNPDASYTFAIARSRLALHEAGIASAYLLLQGNCHVDDARNAVVYEFLKTDCDELVFLDADVSWEPEHLIALCNFDSEMVGGVYPYRREGEGESMPVRMLPGVFEADANGLLEVDGLPTGFLRIKRSVFEKMRPYVAAYDKGGKVTPVFFERDMLGIGRRGGDIGFAMRWRAIGGKCHAAVDLRLGHTGKYTLKDSLAASLRRQTGQTLKYVCNRIAEGKETDDDLAEALRLIDNPYGAPAHVLKIAIGLARSSELPVLEIGTGLSTILVAAAAKDKVWAVEHHPAHADKLRNMVRAAGVQNIALVTAPLKDGWYDLSEDMGTMPERFGLAIVDGPPRSDGKRMAFLDKMADRCDVLLFDDADTDGYLSELTAWAKANGREIQAEDRAAVIYRK